MHQLIRRLRRRHDDGFTLVELVVTVAILGIIVSALAGVVLAYLRTTVDSQARMTESHDVQFVSAYWQRDVASLGVRSTTYDHDPAVHSYALLQSVNVTPSCTLPAGDSVATLAWTQYTATDPDHPRTVTVTYLATKPASRWVLTRVRCTDSTVDSTVQLADNLTVKPVLTCPGAASGCTGAGSDLPTVMTLTLTANDAADPHASDYTATLSGERRQS